MKDVAQAESGETVADELTREETGRPGKQLTVLIIGGYGIFGGRLARLLTDEARLRIIIAGRSLKRAEDFCAEMPAKATLVAKVFDRNAAPEPQLKALDPDVVVDASGPFQVYGQTGDDDQYRLVAAALSLGINYLDLADAGDFAVGISRFDQAARERGLFLLSAVSSFPVLTAAAVRHLARGMASVDEITAGIAPSPWAGVGLNVIRAIAGYAGKPVSLTRNGVRSFGSGLTETRRYTIAPPGRLPLRNRLFSLVDVPDLQLLPPEWPGLRSIWLGAGPVPELLHRALILLAWLVRLKLFRSLTALAPLFHRVANLLRWGEHRGGMFVAVSGTLAGSTDGAAPGSGNAAASVNRSWHLLAEGDDGPFIPAMAIEAIVRKCLAGTAPAAGARAAVNELELEDYERLFAGRQIHTGCRESGAGSDAPLFQKILGSAWHQLPTEIRQMHDADQELIVAGRADIDRGSSLMSRLVGAIFRFPHAGRDVPVRVSFTPREHSEHWCRRFGSQEFSSVLSAGRGRSRHLVEETFGPFSFAMALVVSENRLSFVVRRWRLWRLPLPLALAPAGNSFETVENGKFRFHVEICLPLIGLIVRYRGTLTPRSEAEITSSTDP